MDLFARACGVRRKQPLLSVDGMCLSTFWARSRTSFSVHDVSCGDSDAEDQIPMDQGVPGFPPSSAGATSKGHEPMSLAC